jgi:hypothetical protein
MAEESRPLKQSPNINNINAEQFSQNQPVGGMTSDANIFVEGMSPNEYSFALNARVDAYLNNGVTLGNLGTINNDMGNTSVTTFSSGYLLVAHTFLKGTENELAIFLYNPETKDCEIGILNEQRQYSTLINSTCLGFTDKHSIKVISSLYKTDRVLYWTDDNSKPKYINLDDLNSFKDSNGNFICDSFNVQRSVNKVPNLTLNNVASFGGLLKAGTYMFFVRLLSDNLNATNWISFSNQIPIVKQSFFEYSDITGTYNASSELDRYGVQQTSKSITLNIENLDVNEFSYYQIGVLEYINGNSVAANAYVLKKQPIVNNIEQYTYTGNNTLVDKITTQNEFIVPFVKIDKAKSITTIDNRLIYANTANKKYDWGKFQQAANNIKVDYLTVEIQANDINQNSTKNPKHYDKNKSLMRGEVYALGIVFYLGDYQTPVFHIPGRAKDIYTPAFGNNNNINNSDTYSHPVAITAWDSELVQNRDSEPFGTNNSTERWKIYETAIKDNVYANSTVNFNNTTYNVFGSGKLGYYETDNVSYPNTTDADGNRIYPIGKIRHHKMPSTSLERHCKDDVFPGGSRNQYIYPLGLLFNNINLPAEYASEITGYQIVIGNKLNDNDYIVVDKGIMTQPTINRVLDGVSLWQDIFTKAKAEVDKDYITSSIPFTLSNGFKAKINGTDVLSEGARKHVGIDSPKSKFNNQNLLFDYIKIEGFLNTAGEGLEYFESDADTYKASAYLRRFQNNNNWTGDINYPIESSSFTVYNTSSLTANLGFSDYSASPLRTLNTFQGFRQSALFAELANDRWSPYASNSNKYGDVGDEGITQFNYNIWATYISLQRNISNLHSNLEALSYRKYSEIIYTTTFNNVVTAPQSIGFNGDSFITIWDVRRSLQNPSSDNYIWQMTDLDGSNPNNIKDNKQGYISSNMRFYVESRINTEYRNEGEFDYQTFFTKNALVLDPQYHGDGNASIENVDEFILQEDFQDYNIDYSNLNDIYKFFPVSDDYNSRFYTNDLKYRVWYTERYINGDLIDNRLKVLANNYTELDVNNADQTGITDVFVFQDNLFAHTTRSILQMPLRPQQLKTNENTIYVGQGDFLAVPPKAISTVNYGYGGSKSFNHKIVTEHGVLFIDSFRNKVFLFNNQLKEISRDKQRLFYNYNLDIKLLSSWKSVVDTIDYPFENIQQSPLFVGYTVFYDKIYNRLFVTKRDFDFNVKFEGLLSQINIEKNTYDDSLVFDDNNNKFILLNNTNGTVSITEVDFSNQTYFENKSFTMSYSLMSQSWTSFHSFIPNIVLEDNKAFYTWISDNYKTSNKIWVHGDIWNNIDIEPCSYYDVKYPHIIEFTIIQGNKDVLNKSVVNSFMYSGNTYFKSDNNLYSKVFNQTFNEFYIYNSYQHSGLLNLQYYDKLNNPYGSIKFDTTSSLVDNTTGLWTINEFRDISDENITLVNSELWSDKISNIDYFNGTQGFIDKVPINVNYNKNIYQRRRFKDNYFRLRLIYNYNNIKDIDANQYSNLKLTTNIVLTNTVNSKLK